MTITQQNLQDLNKRDIQYNWVIEVNFRDINFREQQSRQRMKKKSSII